MNQKRLKQTGSTLAKITRVLFWIQFLEMVLAASFVLPAAEKVFVKAFHLSGCNTDAASLSVLIMLTAALLFFLSVLLKSGAERFHDASLYK